MTEYANEAEIAEHIELNTAIPNGEQTTEYEEISAEKVKLIWETARIKAVEILRKAGLNIE